MSVKCVAMLIAGVALVRDW